MLWRMVNNISTSRNIYIVSNITLEKEHMVLGRKWKIAQEVTCKSLISTFPRYGQLEGVRESLILHAASGGITENCFTLSTETILFSMKQLIYMAQNMTAFKDNPYDNVRPTFSAISNDSLSNNLTNS